MSGTGTFSVSFTYVNDPKASFDLDYYLKTHMPLVESKWKEFGLLGYKVVQYDTSDPDNQPPLRVVCISTWKDEASWKNAFAQSCTAAILDDVPNFSSIPVKPYTGIFY
ncbi:hypothetical protein CFIMG_002988RAa [Ceratocystis fimbriata CBS 114723]|uniref:EthD domain-containing protein n=1 Tax=Ceratocystis fimbriata CBS 114723 TaxID=1035309 RepID=A0A2C5X9U2_9PEZI|nr:hypothetical protein CFIMG_002988RAa [Ceratocystis fimbriata CBS 114723]